MNFKIKVFFCVVFVSSFIFISDVFACSVNGEISCKEEYERLLEEISGQSGTKTVTYDEYANTFKLCNTSFLPNTTVCESATRALLQDFNQDPVESVETMTTCGDIVTHAISANTEDLINQCLNGSGGNGSCEKELEEIDIKNIQIESLYSEVSRLRSENARLRSSRRIIYRYIRNPYFRYPRRYYSRW